MFDPKTIDVSKVSFQKLESPGVKFIERKLIDISDVLIPGMKDNPTRIKGKSALHVQNLQQSLANGIDYSQMPPVVYQQNNMTNGTITSYVLATGNHRLEALRNLNMPCWVFDVYSIPNEDSDVGFEDALRTFQLHENNKVPSLASSEDDVVNTISMLVSHNSKLVSAMEDSIRYYVDSVCSNLHPQTKAKVVRRVIRNLTKSGVSVYSDVVSYTAKDVEDFLEKETNYVSFGKHDAIRDQFGWSVLEGYEYEIMVNCMKNFAETGKESYMTLHTKPPTESYSVNDRREKMVKNLQKLENSLIKSYKFFELTGRFPWHVEGFLPQDRLNGEREYIKL